LSGDSKWLSIINEHGRKLKAGAEWLVPAKSLLADILDELAKSASCGYESPTERINILGKILLSADLRVAEKSLAITRLEEAISSSEKRGDILAFESFARGLLKRLADKLRKK